jgi:hypothetical protein
MAARVDIGAMMDMSVFTQRIVLLEDQLARQEQAGQVDPSLLFMVTWACYNASQMDQARAHAGKLLEIASGDPVIIAYAHYVRTGSLPAGYPEPPVQP